MAPVPSWNYLASRMLTSGYHTESMQKTRHIHSTKCSKTYDRLGGSAEDSTSSELVKLIESPSHVCPPQQEVLELRAPMVVMLWRCRRAHWRYVRARLRRLSRAIRRGRRRATGASEDPLQIVPPAVVVMVLRGCGRTNWRDMRARLWRLARAVRRRRRGATSTSEELLYVVVGAPMVVVLRRRGRPYGWDMRAGLGRLAGAIRRCGRRTARACVEHRILVITLSEESILDGATEAMMNG